MIWDTIALIITSLQCSSLFDDSHYLTGLPIYLWCSLSQTYFWEVDTIFRLIDMKDEIVVRFWELDNQTSILLHTLVHTYSLEICNVSQMRFQIIHYNKTEWHSHVVNSLFWVSYDKVFQFMIECTLGWGELVIWPKIELHGDSLACWWTGLFEGILIKGPMFSWKSDTCWILFSSLGYEIKCLSKKWIFFLENELMARTGFDSLWLTHLPLVSHIYVGDLGQHWLR